MDELVDNIYAAGSPDDKGLVSGRVLRPILVKSSVDTKTLAKIWSLVDEEKSGKVTRSQLLLLLRLVSLAQNSQPLDVDFVKNPSSEIPVPTFQGLEFPPATPTNTSQPIQTSTPSAPSTTPASPSPVPGKLPMSVELSTVSPENGTEADGTGSETTEDEPPPVRTDIKQKPKLKYKDFLPQEFKKGGFLIRHAERWEPLAVVLARAKEWMDDMEATPALRKKFKILNFQTLFVDYNENEFFNNHSYVPYSSGQVQIVRVFYEQLS
jgi:hypothetical protein